MNLSAAVLKKLVARARRARRRAYAPYSHFRVGAAVLAASGKVYAGANVENCSYGLSVCAERVAVFQAASAGERRILACAVAGPEPGPVWPCGACRQVLVEFGKDLAVATGGRGRVLVRPLSQILPEAFTQKS